ncbi:hypothetical protein HU200_040991 [Digitaria exilis]|uniref:F-box domain-containing protein n=1 Tax=Digitaria exilis TaxID=1010633 RepID=A0A835EIA1_9POAL|nr:hypothetical protein HU200_040991 [Digitaria exilis]
MESPGPSAPSATGSRPTAASDAGVLLPEVLFDVLLWLPAKELCRLRAVCRSWRALTFDPLFIGENTARHPRHPLFLTNFRDGRTHIHVVDVSGSVVKRIPIPDGNLLLPTSLDLACVATVRNSCRVLDPATGGVHVLPESPAAEHAGREILRQPYTCFAFGRMAATGDYKVLRMFSRPDLFGFHQHHLFEVFTINSCSGSGSSQPQWRARGSHEEFVEPGSVIVVGEMVYFKIDTIYDFLIVDYQHDIPLDRIIPFNLKKEEWGAILPGPISDIFQTDEYDDHLEDYRSLWIETTLAELRGSLALVHYRTYRHIMDVWLLKDFDDVLWVKEYTIQIEPIVPTTELCVKSLFMLGDGRLVIHFPENGMLLIHDARTHTSTPLETGYLDAVAMYIGNLLSLQAGNIV